MTLSEFKHWLDGFSEAVGEAPTPDQWAKIKAKIAQAGPLPGGAGDYPYPPTTTITQADASITAWIAGQVPLGAEATNAIFSDIESLYEN